MKIKNVTDLQREKGGQESFDCFFDGDYDAEWERQLLMKSGAAGHLEKPRFVHIAEGHVRISGPFGAVQWIREELSSHS